MSRNKWTALLLTIALTVFAMGCGGDSGHSNTTNSNAANSNANTHK